MWYLIASLSESESDAAASAGAQSRAWRPPKDAERPRTHPGRHPQRSQHSRLQHCEEGVGLWSLLQLTALLSAQPDDVTEGLRGVGLSLEGKGDAALPSGLRRKSSRAASRTVGATPLLSSRKDTGLSKPVHVRAAWLAFLLSGCKSGQTFWMN